MLYYNPYYRCFSEAEDLFFSDKNVTPNPILDALIHHTVMDSVDTWKKLHPGQVPSDKVLKQLTKKATATATKQWKNKSNTVVRDSAEKMNNRLNNFGKYGGATIGAMGGAGLGALIGRKLSKDKRRGAIIGGALGGITGGVGGYFGGRALANRKYNYAIEKKK